MNALFSYLLMIAMVAVIVYLVKFLRQRSKDRNKALHDLKMFFLSITVIVICSIGVSVTDTPQNHMTAKQIRQTKQKKAEKAKAKKQKDITKQQDLKNLRNDLKQVPTETKGLITSTDLSSDGNLTATMSDKVLEGNSAQIKEIAKTAANQLSKLVDKNYPLPSPYDEADVGVTINDSAGNQLYQMSTNPF